jgi:hypothetical protein
VLLQLFDLVRIVAREKPKIAVEFEFLRRHRPAPKIIAIHRRKHAKVYAVRQFSNLLN